MVKKIVRMDGLVVQEFVLEKERTTLGRRPYNDIVIDKPAVSGEHALFELIDQDVILQDANSTNGCYVNGSLVTRQKLCHGDMIEFGQCLLKFVDADVYDPLATRGLVPPRVNVPPASIRLFSGPAIGQTQALVKVVTTIGTPGDAVAAITRRPSGFVLAHVEGDTRASVNGVAIGLDVVPLQHGDKIELNGLFLQFLQDAATP